jgi:probable rRNA maturation factor
MSDGRLELSVQYAVPRRGLPHRTRLVRWIEAALTRPARLTVRFVGAREGRALNRDFRRRDYATNVLTFAYGRETRARGAPLAGDLVLCAPVAAREARAEGKPLDAHYAHLVVHGTLHLLGWMHERAGDAERMERREARILARLGYPDPYLR